MTFIKIESNVLILNILLALLDFIYNFISILYFLSAIIKQ